jgi:hypothetical protein
MPPTMPQVRCGTPSFTRSGGQWAATVCLQPKLPVTPSASFPSFSLFSAFRRRNAGRLLGAGKASFSGENVATCSTDKPGNQRETTNRQTGPYFVSVVMRRRPRSIGRIRLHHTINHGHIRPGWEIVDHTISGLRKNVGTERGLRGGFSRFRNPIIDAAVLVSRALWRREPHLGIGLEFRRHLLLSLAFRNSGSEAESLEDSI